MLTRTGIATLMTIALGLPFGANASTALTIYSTAQPGAVPAHLYRPGNGRHGDNVPGYAIVRDSRPISLDQYRNTVRFTDVASLIDPTTVAFTSMTDPHGTRVLEQNYQFDLVSSDKLLDKYIDREITVETVHGNNIESITGTLLSTVGGMVLRDKQGKVQILRSWSNVRFPELPGGLITRPTLIWDIETSRPGEHEGQVSYQTGGITWWADYNLVYSEGRHANDCNLDISSWVSVVNQSGATFTDTKLKLVAGNVHRAPQQLGRHVRKMSALAEGSLYPAAAPGFVEKSFFEYHLYTLGRPTTLANNSTKQIEMFPQAKGVACHKDYLYTGGPGYGHYWSSPRTDRAFGIQSNKKVDTWLRFANEKANHLGIPLPAGRIRVSKRDMADGALEFIGEDTIDHTPKDEQVMIKLGSAFDIVGERRQVDFHIDTRRKVIEETIEVKLRNHKDEPVTILVKENLYRWSNWQITSKNHKFNKLDSRTIQFPVRVAKDGETVLTYKVRYTWQE